MMEHVVVDIMGLNVEMVDKTFFFSFASSSTLLYVAGSRQEAGMEALV